MFASGGYARFLVPVSGLLAVLAAGGLQAIVARQREYMAALVLAIGAIWLPITAFVVWDQWNSTLWEVLLPVAGVLAVAAVVAWVLRAGRWRKAVVVGSIVVVGVIQLPRLIPEFRPLKLSDSPMHMALIDARDAVAAKGYGDRLAYSQHVLLQHHRPNTRAAYGNEWSIDMWREAEPGTLYVWENKYASKAHDPESSEELTEVLARYGECIYDTTRPAANDMETPPRVMVYVRKASEEVETAVEADGGGAETQ
jgi:hypothetical protein